MKNVYTVKQVNSYIKNMFNQDFMLNRIYVKGEVSNCKYHTSGHIYFSLKDESGTIACVMFAGSRSGLSFHMEEGQQVVVLGAVSVYERDGKYQLYAREIELDGAGNLYLKFEALKKELEEMGYVKENVETYLQLFKDVAPDVTGIRFLKEKLGDCLSEETADSMEMIISSVETAKECEFNIKFDPTLVRGQSYYTGTIFEVTMDDFGGSVAGGGRYDKMIGKFTGQDTPACGFSIGFERIVMLLLENGYEVPTVKEKKAYLLEKKMTKEGLLKVMSLAKADRQAGKQVLIVNMKKNKKFQKEQLTEDGYTEIVDCYADSVENL